MRIEDLERDPPHLSSGSRTADLLAELMPRRRKLLAALQGHPVGWIERGRPIAAGLTADDSPEARKLEWRSKTELSKQATFDELRRAIRKAVENRGVVGFWGSAA